MRTANEAPMRAILIAALLSLPLPAPAEEEDHLAEAEGLRVLHAWTNAGDGDTAEVYMEIENTGSTGSNLVEVSAEGAEMATLVASPIRAGGGTPETLDGILLPAGIETRLEPRGLYVLLTGVGSPRAEGDEMELTLTFEPQGEIEVRVDVEAADATEHSHAGHSH